MAVRMLICGSRDFTDGALFHSVMTNLPERFRDVSAVIEGGAKGADRMGREWAELMAVPVETYEADWQTHGKRAGYLRNVEMLAAEPDVVLAFFSKPDSRGTRMMVDLATKDGVETYRFGNWSA